MPPRRLQVSPTTLPKAEARSHSAAARTKPVDPDPSRLFVGRLFDFGTRSPTPSNGYWTPPAGSPRSVSAHSMSAASPSRGRETATASGAGLAVPAKRSLQVHRGSARFSASPHARSRNKQGEYWSPQPADPYEQDRHKILSTFIKLTTVYSTRICCRSAFLERLCLNATLSDPGPERLSPVLPLPADRMSGYRPL